MSPTVRLAPLPPSPTGAPLVLSVRCSTSPDMVGATRHDVALDADWTLATPHDLPAERIAAAFGGYLSCLHLVDVVVPTVRESLQMHGRRVAPRLRRAARGTWKADGPAAQRCCAPAPTAQQAAAHLRSVEHAATRGGADRGLTQALLERVLAAHQASGTLVMAPEQSARMSRCVLGERGAVALWDAGLHPAVVSAVHDEVVGPDGPPLPEALYLGVVSRRPNLAWIADTVAAARAALGEAPDDDDTPWLAEWLAWTQTPLDRKDRHVRAAWVASGIPRSWIEELSAAGYRPDDAAVVARGTGRSLSGVADMLLQWVRAGCRPTADDLLDLFASGVPPWYEPSKGAITRLRGNLGDVAERYTTTELGLMLALEGTALAAERVIRTQAAPPRTLLGRHRAALVANAAAREECA